ncbi:MAG: hypothetical protein MI867_24515 [Pseudomonadales bacterium]|nr:hypothetical protein [Pseudomonadales bacterium]
MSKKKKSTSVSDFLLNLSIQRKWFNDKKQLPLKKEHKDLHKIIHVLFNRELGCFPNLVDPQNYNDKIQWLKLFDQDKLNVQCSDKLGLRDYVTSVLGDGHLPEVYAQADSLDAIDFSSLPKSFVLKTNHDSGTVFLVRDKDSYDNSKANTKITKSLKRVYGQEKGEWCYTFVKPKVFAEEFIGDVSDDSPPPDFKFHCSKGKVKWLQYIFDRANTPKEVICNEHGEPLNISFDHNMIPSTEFVKPAEWNDLITAAEKLSEPFKYVRVDLYLISGNVFVGELTFFPLKGCYKGEGQEKLGELLEFDLKTFKDIYAP